MNDALSSLPSTACRIPASAGCSLAGVHISLARTPADYERVCRFRYDIYVREMGKPLATADHAKGVLADPADEGAHLLFATDVDGAVIGTLRLHLGNVPATTTERVGAELLPVRPDQCAFASKTMVDRGRRGSQVFVALARTALEMAQAAGIRFGLLHCRPSLVPLYARLGYRRHATPFVDPEVGEQVPMVLDLQQIPDTLGGRHSSGRAA